MLIGFINPSSSNSGSVTRFRERNWHSASLNRHPRIDKGVFMLCKQRNCETHNRKDGKLARIWASLTDGNCRSRSRGVFGSLMGCVCILQRLSCYEDKLLSTSDELFSISFKNHEPYRAVGLGILLYKVRPLASWSACPACWIEFLNTVAILSVFRIIVIMLASANCAWKNSD